MDENLKSCKWCSQCNILSLEKNSGYCYLDIGEYVELDHSCCFHKFDDDLDRC